MRLTVLALSSALLLAACAGKQADPTVPPPSPREQAKLVDTGYQALLTAADNAMDAPQLSATVKQQIAVSSRAATDAMHKLNAAALDCIRDPATGKIVDAPDNPAGEHCDPSGVTGYAAAAQAAIGHASDVLNSFGVKVGN